MIRINAFNETCNCITDFGVDVVLMQNRDLKLDWFPLQFMSNKNTAKCSIEINHLLLKIKQFLI